MRTILFAIILLTTNSYLSAQPYLPNWESLDKRPTPQWFKDSKFGIFIHWGVYAVPGWSPKGRYAEWYQNGLNSGDSSIMDFHRKKFGSLSYYELAGQFKAELFNPEEWAHLFEQSGAKYIVLTSKHHDGFALWPSKDASRTWGFPWNAFETGPKRDLLGDLFKAVRKTSVHPGMYYSLYEWYNPLWKSNPARFAEEHTWPQMKDLITTYQPDVFWTDGDWDAPAEIWKSQQFLAWLFNESPVKEEVIVNDRWGKGIRFHHAGIYTPEYQPDVDFENHYWEESRGMGFSYGYNRQEDAWDYNSAQSLILQLIDKVSRGGNFLLDIGPDEHGKIPPIMQERLLQMGEWLHLNGEAIYRTSRWKIPSQWSEGRRDFKLTNGAGDLLLKLTVDPDPGFAVEEVFFTYQPISNCLYAIIPKYPENKEVILKNVQFLPGTKLSLLSTNENLRWRQLDGNVLVSLPEFQPGKIKAPYAYAIKIENYGKFTAAPQLNVTYPQGSVEPLATLNAGAGNVIRYTTDGSEPSALSPIYVHPLNLVKTTTLKAIAFNDGALPSRTLEKLITKYEWFPATHSGKVAAGLSYHYYEPSPPINLDSWASSPQIKTGVTSTFSLKEKQRKEKFAFVFEGYVKINRDGIYTFFILSDDGSKLYLDNNEVVNNDGKHSSALQSGQVALKKGLHRIKVLYFDSGGDNDLKVYYSDLKGKREEIPADMLFHNK